MPTTKKVSELEQGDRVTISGTPADDTVRDGPDGGLVGPDDIVTVAGTVDSTEMRSIQVDVVNLVSDEGQRWSLKAGREDEVVVHD
ncbi:hypothetical protein ACWIDS_15875 [Dietzia maris]